MAGSRKTTSGEDLDTESSPSRADAVASKFEDSRVAEAESDESANDESAGDRTKSIAEMSDEEFEAPVRGDPDPVSDRRRPLKFDKLRIDGFKSFPDRVEIEIEPGMTGVVGPNGCGKSNLLESLRWVFGETSAKNMRGGAMDDVIFGGAERRPPRNIAEVVLVIDNSQRNAPPSMNDADTLEITRRIERGQGTSYRVNGKAARQRDIQILFQDLGSGARSSSIVSQGRVGSLINAKPGERRTVLEEAAGVSGLSSRRHETELRLKNTELNISRTEDALLQSSTLLGSLRKQARQAQRRREIDGKIREALAGVLLIRHLSASRAEARARADHEANEAKVVEAMIAANAAQTERDRAVQALPPLQEARIAAETALARARVKLEGIAAEAGRNKKAIEEAERRILELGADRQREDEVVIQAEVALRKLGEERQLIADRRANEGDMMEEASDEVENASRMVAEADAQVAKLATEMATREANYNAALAKRDDARTKAEAVERKLIAAEQRLQRERETSPQAAALAEAADVLSANEERVSILADDLAKAETKLVETRSRDEAAQVALAANGAEIARARAEASGLAAVRASTPSKAPISGRLSVEPGYEAALAAALGESLSYGLDSSEAAWWGSTAAAPPAVEGYRLKDFVSGVSQLDAALSAVIVVDDVDEYAEAVRSGLPFGVTAVTRSGRFVRWDGFAGRLKSESVEGALKRANRLKALGRDIERLETESVALTRARADAAQAFAAARSEESRLRQESRDAAIAERAARESHARLQKAGEESRQKLAVAEAETAAIRLQRAEALAAFSSASDALASVPPNDETRNAHAAAKRRVSETREAEAKKKAALERMIVESGHRRTRFEAILRETADWTQRLAQAKARRQELGARADEAQRLRDEAAARPTASKDAIEEAASEAEAATRASQVAIERLVEAEKRRDASDAHLRKAEEAMVVLRERRATLLAAIEASQREGKAAAQAIVERMPGPDGEPLTPEDLAAIAAIDPMLPHEVHVFETRLGRLERERETLGEVNFLAEAELVEQEKRYGDIEKARDELRQTIVKLRQAIAEIDREARAKLETAFRQIDTSFGELFTRLFSGGEAHLRLVNSDDILEAGLEIYASPPGKRMQVLSLLSGGEQALTAMALIFAAFLSNPAPVCVLDEVDAPLDDANADRLCRLVATMAENDATRFLVVTHNPLTMARMNRLYGVTMEERGVSSLTMVDLDKAIAIVDQAA